MTDSDIKPTAKNLNVFTIFDKLKQIITTLNAKWNHVSTGKSYDAIFNR
jgi:hypothetical protein